MNLKEAKKSVINSANKLLQAGLVARTWGNVSCRLDESHFAITPSGRSYVDMLPDEIVIANIHDDQYWGSLLPSSETGLHREVYRRRPEVGFVIHTHQFEASVFSAFERTLSVRGEGIFGGEVPCARYGFPGSDELRRHVVEALESTVGPAALMAHHGALIMGQGEEDTFRLSLVLEVASFRRINDALTRMTGENHASREGLYDYLLAAEGYHSALPQHAMPASTRNEDGFDIDDGDKTVHYRLDDDTLSPALDAMRQIYLARPDIHAIVQGLGGACLAFSVLGTVLPSYLDDCCQIAGVGISCAPFEPKAIASHLGNNHAVFVEECGILCCGSNMDDANAVALVVEKNVRVHFVGPLFGGANRLEDEDIDKMRAFYLDTYSKRY